MQAVTTVDEALLGTIMGALHFQNNHRLPDCFVTAVALVTVLHHVLQEAQVHGGSSALLNPETSILIQKHHSHTKNLYSEMSGGSNNACLHCGDVLAHEQYGNAGE